MKDPRYQIVRDKILSGEITTLAQIFDHIPMTVLTRDLWCLEHFGTVLESSFDENELENLLQDHKKKDPQP